MLKIRLSRIGRKHDPSYRIVVAEARSSRNKTISDIGFYDPLNGKMEVNKEDALSWIAKGAKPTYTVHSLLYKADVVQDKPKQVTRVKKEDKK